VIDYPSNIKQIENAIQDSNPGLAFENLILSLSANGKSKTEIYAFLSRYQFEEKDTKSYLKVEQVHVDHPIEGALDRLWGWCHKDARLLTDEVIDESGLPKK